MAAASTEKTRPSLFWALAVVVVPFVTYLSKMRFTGREKLPAEGSFVLAPNHYSEFDPLIVAAAVSAPRACAAVHGEGESVPGAGRRCRAARRPA